MSRSKDEITVEVQSLKNVFGIVSAYGAIVSYRADVRRKIFPVPNVGTDRYDPELQKRRAWAWCGTQKSQMMKAAESNPNANEDAAAEAERRMAQAAAEMAKVRAAKRQVCAEVHHVRNFYGMGPNRTRTGYVNVYGNMTEGDDA